MVVLASIFPFLGVLLYGLGGDVALGCSDKRSRIDGGLAASVGSAIVDYVLLNVGTAGSL